MTSEQSFIFVIVAIVVTLVAIFQVNKNRYRIKRVVLDRLNISSKAEKRKSDEPELLFADSEPGVLSAEEKSEAEFERLQKLIEDRKQVARDTDISHHLWGLYKSHFRYTSPESLDRYIQDGEWYYMKILQVSTKNALNKFEFELKGARYTFVDDEEKQGWRENMKYFSLFLHDDSDRCLIEIPMKVSVDSCGRRYSIISSGPNSFLPGEWIKDFINVKLKNQRIRNQEIRAQKHQERLAEIEDLKNRFGISRL
ncbi:hypothetical protein ACFL00_01570 [Pseudomonadota bacterium]